MIFFVHNAQPYMHCNRMAGFDTGWYYITTAMLYWYICQNKANKQTTNIKSLPDTLLFRVPFVPFWCFLSRGEGGALGLLSNEDGEGEALGLLSNEDGEGDALGLLSWAEGEGVGRLSSGEREGLRRPSGAEGGVVERGVAGPRPFTNFSWGLWEASDDLREAAGDWEEAAEDEEEE